MKPTKIAIVMNQINRHFPYSVDFDVIRLLDVWDHEDWKPKHKTHASQFLQKAYRKGLITQIQPGKHHSVSWYRNKTTDPKVVAMKVKKTRVGVKMLKPALKKALNKDYDFNTIGQAIVFIMKKQKDQIEELKRQVFEQDVKIKDLRKTNREVTDQLESNQQDLEEFRETVQAKTGKFSLGEMLSGDEVKALLIEP